MRKIEEARDILVTLQASDRQRTDLCCYALLALAGIEERSPWAHASNCWLRIHDIIAYTREHYGVVYAENSRETFRKQAMHHFRYAAFIEDNGEATNSPNYRYRLTEEMLRLVRSYGTDGWDSAGDAFRAAHVSLMDIYASRRRMRRVPIMINGKVISFSSGSHNELQKAIIEEFAPRFAPGAECLYVGDTSRRDLVKDVAKLSDLGLTVTLHDKMPDVILYSAQRDWLYFIEAVTSVGPMEPKRIKEIEDMARGATAGKIYVTAFHDFKTFKRFSEVIAWETEVWIASMPDHMIHLDGEKFLGLRR